MTTQSVTVVRIGSTGYCISEHVAGYVTSAAVAPLVNDTLVFLAISWRLMQNSVVGEKHRFRLRAMILGQRMPSLSHALLKDGQIYYLTTVTSNLLTVVLMALPSLPVTYRTMLAGPNIMLMNIMACRVFRKTKLGLFDNDAIPTFHTDDS
uniref:Uncharacterized protein n=1 Tax=Psilocybe cubensis TaxID=181762 RepID=A0A8H7XNM8_PSICU